MITLHLRNVNDALPMAVRYLEQHGIRRESRNGAVLVAPNPVCTLYEEPEERVLFCPTRDANPFFHLVESVWMMAGRDDVALPATYAKNISSFSDDGKTLHGAYGYRWRRALGYDQLPVIIEELRSNPDSRRCVLQMWDASPNSPKISNDLNMARAGGRDVPCNTHIYFSVHPTRGLDMTVCNRSNDVVWGAYGANAVHMSFLQEFVARALGLPVGCYWQMSNNFHMYDFNAHLARGAEVLNPYAGVGYEDRIEPPVVAPYPIMEDGADYRTWLEDAEMFLGEGLRQGCRHPWFQRVLWPVVNAHEAYRGKDYTAAREIVAQCAASDWRVACTDWLDRRAAKRESKGG